MSQPRAFHSGFRMQIDSFGSRVQDVAVDGCKSCLKNKSNPIAGHICWGAVRSSYLLLKLQPFNSAEIPHIRCCSGTNELSRSTSTDRVSRSIQPPYNPEMCVLSGVPGQQSCHMSLDVLGRTRNEHWSLQIVAVEYGCFPHVDVGTV